MDARRHYLVVMGAAVWPGGEPSRAMRRRVRAALDASAREPRALFLPTGAVGRHGPSEASVMRDLLCEAGVAPERIVLEESGHDTLASVRACAHILHQRGDAARVTVCSDGYHLPRCRLLFRALGVRTEPAAAGGSRAALGTPRWLYQWSREVAGMPWDLALALSGRRRDHST